MTEMVADNLNPQFVTEVLTEYYFELQQTLLIEVYDADDATCLGNLQKQEFIGSFSFHLGKLCSSANQELTGPLESSVRANSGQIKVMAEEKKADYGRMQASFTVSAGLSSQDFGANFFMTINKFKSPGKYQPVYKTETKPQAQGAVVQWNKLLIDTDTLCDSDYSQEIMVQVFKYNSRGNHKKVEQGSITLSQLVDSGSQARLNLSHGGYLLVDGFQVNQRVSFLDYIFGGCEIGVQVAIDFTMSNGNPQSPSSLHYLNPHTQTNDYTEAIKAVMEILENYDADKMFPVYGFGGKLSGTGRVSHCFALNGNIYDPEVNGVKGVMKAYYDSLKSTDLYGGTEFSSVLSYVNGYAEQNAREISQFNQKYTICLILTDGIINDMDRTIDEVVRGSVLPLSIIIVGIGGADFDQMETLDGDVNPLYSRSRKQYCARDIVQFVPFRELKNDPVRLAKEVLAEIPKQLTDYFAARNIQPNPKKLDDKQDLRIQGLMKNQLQQMMNVPESYFVQRKLAMINALQQQGFDPGVVGNYIDTRGFPSEDMQWARWIV